MSISIKMEGYTIGFRVGSPVPERDKVRWPHKNRVQAKVQLTVEGRPVGTPFTYHYHGDHPPTHSDLLDCIYSDASIIDFETEDPLTAMEALQEAGIFEGGEIRREIIEGCMEQARRFKTLLEILLVDQETFADLWDEMY